MHIDKTQYKTKLKRMTDKAAADRVRSVWVVFTGPDTVCEARAASVF